MLFMGLVGLFFDFDVTLSPVDVAGGDARVRSDVAEALEESGSRYLPATAGSKDCGLLLRGAPFFHANGLEVLTGSYLAYDSVVAGSGVLSTASQVAPLVKGMPSVYAGERALHANALLGVSVGWEGITPGPKGVDRVVALATSRRPHVPEYDSYPLDIYASRGKGGTIKLNEAVNGLGGTVYLGDSVDGVPAPGVADVPVQARRESNRGLRLYADCGGRVPRAQHMVEGYAGTI